MVVLYYFVSFTLILLILEPEIKSPNLPKPATKPNIVAKSQPLDDAEEENGWDDDGDGWGDMDVSLSV